MAFVDQHRQQFGVESICRVMEIALSAYWRHAALQRNPALCSLRAQRDASLVPKVQRVWQTNIQVYGVATVWRQLNREGKTVRTTVLDFKALCPLDRVNRELRPERHTRLWILDFAYLSTWQGWVYVTFVADVSSRRIVGWRQSNSIRTEFVLNALEKALYDRKPAGDGSLRVTPTAGRNTYTFATASDWLRPTTAVGSKGDSHHHALGEPVNGLYKAEVIHRRGSWKANQAVELATLE